MTGNPPRKQNLHARKLRERSVPKLSRESSGDYKRSHIFMCIIIYGQFSAQTAQEITKQMSPRKLQAAKPADGEENEEPCLLEPLPFHWIGGVGEGFP